jgi:hypothetical protein
LEEETMRPNAPQRRPARALRSALYALAALVVVLLAGDARDLSAAPPGPTVSAATPSQGEQGTLGLEVVIDGNGFEEGSNAVFLRSGTADPTGIAVLSTEYVSRKQVRARLDIAEDAPLELYDIEIQSANGRKGKGTELFGVVQKGQGGGAPLAPGAPLDFSVTAVDFTSVDLSWTETADDGYDETSGPVEKYEIAWRHEADGSPSAENWYQSTTERLGGSPGVAPGAPSVRQAGPLQPLTSYYLAIRAEDGDGNVSEPVVVGPVTTAEFPETDWSVEMIAECERSPAPSPAMAFDALGNPVASFHCGASLMFARWNGSSWESEGVAARDSAGGPSIALDPQTNEMTVVAGATFYRRTASGWQSELIDRKGRYGQHVFDGGVLHVIYERSVGPSRSCARASRDASGWTIETVDAETICRDPRLAIDPAGTLAVIYREDHDGDGWMDGVKVATNEDGSWSVRSLYDSSVSGSDPLGVNNGRVVYDATSGRFTAAFEVRARSDLGFVYTAPSVILCHRGASDWACEASWQGPEGWLAFQFVPGEAGKVAINERQTLTVWELAGSTWSFHGVIDWGVWDHTPVTTDASGVLHLVYDHWPGSNAVDVIKHARREP